MRGSNVCRMHGGAAPQVRAKAAERVAHEKARAVLNRLGVPVETDPISALRGLIDEANGNVEAFRTLVTDRAPEGIRPDDPLWSVYGQERDRLHRIAKDATSLDLDERQVRVDEAIAKQVMGAIEAVLAGEEFGLDDDRRDWFKRSFAAELVRNKPDREVME